MYVDTYGGPLFGDRNIPGYIKTTMVVAVMIDIEWKKNYLYLSRAPTDLPGGAGPSREGAPNGWPNNI